MYIICLLAALGALAVTLGTRRLLTKRSPGILLTAGLFGLVLGAFVGVVLSILLTYQMAPLYSNSQVVEQYRLVSIRDSVLPGGSLFLGSGRIGLKLSYSYYIENLDAIEARILVVSEGHVTIREEERENAVLNVSITSMVLPWWLENQILDKLLRTQKTYEFVVPKGTVRRDLSL